MAIIESMGRACPSRFSWSMTTRKTPMSASPPEVVQESLLKDRMTFICRPDHPLAARKRVKWEEVLREPVVSLTQDFTTRLQADLFKHSSALVLSPAHSVSFITTALGMVQWGHGVTAQPESVIPLLAPFGRVEPVGRSFPVYKVAGVDVALPRRESKSGRGHTAFAVEGDPSMPLREAAHALVTDASAALQSCHTDPVAPLVGTASEQRFDSVHRAD